MDTSIAVRRPGRTPTELHCGSMNDTLSGSDPYNYTREHSITLPDGRTINQTQVRTWDGTDGTMERSFIGPNGQTHQSLRSWTPDGQPSGTRHRAMTEPGQPSAVFALDRSSNFATTRAGQLVAEAKSLPQAGKSRLPDRPPRRRRGGDSRSARPTATQPELPHSALGNIRLSRGARTLTGRRGLVVRLGRCLPKDHRRTPTEMQLPRDRILGVVPIARE